MGSVLTQIYMMQHGRELQGYIISGAIRQSTFMANIGSLISGTLSTIFGPADRSNLLITLGYGPYNNKFRPNRTKSDWLCSVNGIVDEYIDSPLCGKPCTNRFYQNLSFGFKYISSKNNLKQIPAETPVFIFAGKRDPAGNFGKAPLKINDLLTKQAHATVLLKLYPGCRHEVLNEKNREEVYKDVLEWMIAVMSRKPSGNSF